MKIDSEDFHVHEGEEVHLDQWPTLVKRVYRSKKKYQALLEEQVAELSELQRLLYAFPGSCSRPSSRWRCAFREPTKGAAWNWWRFASDWRKRILHRRPERGPVCRRFSHEFNQTILGQPCAPASGSCRR